MEYQNRADGKIRNEMTPYQLRSCGRCELPSVSRVGPSVVGPTGEAPGSSWHSAFYTSKSLTTINSRGSIFCRV